MKALVTGATGFKGRHLVALLAKEGAEVHALVRTHAGVAAAPPNVSAVHPGDLLDAASLAEAVKTSRPDVVFHFAAQSNVPTSWQQRDLTHRTNGDGTRYLLDAIRDFAPGATVIVACTSEEYGTVEPYELPITEAQPRRPLSPYAVSKMTADGHAAQYFRSYGVRTVRTRSFNCEGPGRPDSFAPSGFAAQIARIEAGQQPPVIRHGNLDAVRDYLDVRDAVRAYRLAAESGVPGEVYNFASGVGRTLRSCLEALLSQACGAATGALLELDPLRARPSDVPRLVGDSTKFRAATGWAPEIPWEQTLRDLLDWWRVRVREGRP